MSKLIILSEARIGASETDAIEVVLVEPDDMPSSIIIHWPGQPSVANPSQFPETAAKLTRLFARAATKLSRIRSGLHE
jgi:hypothetical protein